MMAPAVPLIMEDFGVTNSSLGTFCVSVFVLGFAFGPMIIAPCSEVYGRNIVYHVCNSLFVVFTIACALSTNMGMLIAFRFCAGFAGVAVLTCGSGTIADIAPPEMRGRAMGIWSIGPMIGPVVGPVCAGFLVEDKSWHWVFWIIAIFVRIPLLFHTRTGPPSSGNAPVRDLRPVRVALQGHERLTKSVICRLV